MPTQKEAREIVLSTVETVAAATTSFAVPGALDTDQPLAWPMRFSNRVTGVLDKQRVTLCDGGFVDSQGITALLAHPRVIAAGGCRIVAMCTAATSHPPYVWGPFFADAQDAFAVIEADDARPNTRIFEETWASVSAQLISIGDGIDAHVTRDIELTTISNPAVNVRAGLRVRLECVVWLTNPIGSLDVARMDDYREVFRHARDKVARGTLRNSRERVAKHIATVLRDDTRTPPSSLGGGGASPPDARPRAMCFAGAGLRAFATYSGVLVAIQPHFNTFADMMANVPFVVGNSGGAWFVLLLAFSRTFLRDDTNPRQLTSAGFAAYWDRLCAQRSLSDRYIGLGDGSWRALRHFLQPREWFAHYLVGALAENKDRARVARARFHRDDIVPDLRDNVEVVVQVAITRLAYDSELKLTTRKVARFYPVAAYASIGAGRLPPVILGATNRDIPVAERLRRKPRTITIAQILNGIRDLLAL